MKFGEMLAKEVDKENKLSEYMSLSYLKLMAENMEELVEELADARIESKFIKFKQTVEEVCEDLLESNLEKDDPLEAQ